MQLIGESEIDSLSIVLCKSGIIGARKVSNCLMVKRCDCIKKGEKRMKYVEPEMEILEVEQDDVITASNVGTSGEDGEDDFKWN